MGANIGQLYFSDFEPYGSYPSAGTAAELASEVSSKNAMTLIGAIESLMSSLATSERMISDTHQNPTLAVEANTTGIDRVGSTDLNNIKYTKVSASDVPTAPTAVAGAPNSNVTVPAIDDAPTFNAAAASFQWSESLVEAPLLDEATAVLLNDLANGGYGINVSDENALWQRARDRESIDTEAAISAVAQQAAARGFSLPPGVLNKQIMAAQQAALAKNSSVSRDIALKRADMYVENRRFTIEQIRQLELVVLERLNSYRNRQMEAAKMRLEAFNSAVRLYDTAVRVFQTKVSAADLKLRASIASVDASVRSYSAQVQQYSATIQGYSAQAQAKAELARVQVLDAKNELDASVAKVDAKLRAGDLDLRAYGTGLQRLIDKERLAIDAIKETAEIQARPISALTSLAEAYLSANTSISAVIE